MNAVNTVPEPAPSGEPVIKHPDDYTGPMFSREVIEEFQKFSKEPWLAVVRRASTWHYHTQQNPTLPKVEELTPFDVPAVRAIRGISPGETWEQFAKKCNLNLSRRLDETNPWLPGFVNKSDDRPTSWNRSNAGSPLADNAGCQEAFVKMLKEDCPFGASTGLGAAGNTLAHSAIGTMVTEDIVTLGEIVDQLAKLHRFWFKPLGAEYLDAEFRYGKHLCLLTGLGFGVVRAVASRLKDYYEGLDFWETCHEDQLRESAMVARRIHGYPMGLLRVDGAKLTAFLERRSCAPGDWFTLVILTHILKYARFSHVSDRGCPVVQVIRDGRRNLFYLDATQLRASFGMSQNTKLRIDVLKALGLPTSVNADFPPPSTSVLGIFDMLRPTDLCELRSLDDLIHLAVPRAVELVPTMKYIGEYMFVDYGIGATNVAHIDYDSGKVVIEEILTGLDIGAIQWPEGALTKSELMTWKSCLPKEVKPMLPSETVFKYIRNCNDLGMVRARNAIFDTWILLNLARPKLAGTKLGNSMVNEYPIGMILPMGHTKEETTNQGKTNLGRIMLHTICPNVPVIIPSRSSSAPAQRAAASPLDDYGTAIYDEFQLPSSHEHFLAQAGLQSLATGGTVTPGRAMENSKGVKLKHSMVICAKISAFPVDIRNRSFCFFMDTIDDKSRCTDEELTIIGTGVAASTVRMNALAWMDRIGFVEKLNTIVPKASKHNRFSAFIAVAVALCQAAGGTEKEVYDYFEACANKCEDQHLKATESGLADEIGANGEFSARHFFSQCTVSTLEIIARNDGKMWGAAEMLRKMVEDQDQRRYSDVLREYHIKESTAVQKFCNAVKDGKMVIDGWKIESYHDPRSPTEKRRYYRMVRGNFNCDPTAPSAEELNAHFKAGEAPVAAQAPTGTQADVIKDNLKRDTASDIKDVAQNPDKYGSDKPQPNRNK